MPLRAGPHETRGHDGTTLEAALLVERLAVDQPSGSLAVLSPAGFLHDAPLREAPNPDASRRLARIVRIGRRREEPGGRDVGHHLELPSQPGLDDLLEVRCLRPGVETPDDGRMVRQVDQRARPVGGDDLPAADLPMCPPTHPESSTWRPLRSFKNKFTSGSTSRSERLVRNFRWCSDRKSVSSISRKRGWGCFSSYF